MSEEILKALTTLFAIITKQEEGTSEKEREFVLRFFKSQLPQDAVGEYLAMYDELAEVNKPEEVLVDGAEVRKTKLTSVKDSVRTLAMCKKINKTLTQKQKVVVLMKLLELVNVDEVISPLRMQIIDTVAEVFNIDKEEFKIVESFVTQEDITQMDYPDILIVDGEERRPFQVAKCIHVSGFKGQLAFFRSHSVDLYFVRYLGSSEVQLNGFAMKADQVNLFSNGSVVKPSSGAPFYYNEIVAGFQSDGKKLNLSFHVNDLEFRFPNGALGLRGINLSEGPGSLIGIMGASGSGKTTLLNVLAGIEKPSKGEVLINGINIHTEQEKIEGVIGYIAQDDILFEDLTVFENLYFNAQLCFKDKSKEELQQLVEETLSSLGLLHIKELKVGNVLNKKISGGQRKRLNIALELIREPSILFVDEPTSGLSSRDSENVIELLKELTLKGKLIFVVIHQPSSDIYKMFDKMFFMDTGGYPIFNGYPIDAVTYFKKATNQVDSERGQCFTCGNVNPEQIFNIIEAKVVNEYGQYTNQRKVTPVQWGDLFKERFVLKHVEEVKEEPPKSLAIPNRFRQLSIFVLRDMLAKVTNMQYMLINLLEAPLLALLLAFIIRYNNNSEGTGYLFRFNENLPAFLLIAVIIALFMGLTVSAEEIIKDRKIQKRESFLNLSRSSYLLSKVTILFLLSAIQTLTFVLIGNVILEIHGMTVHYWLILFSVSCFANLLGLNISSSFNSAVTIYILIPLLLIPQMILSGAIFSFDKLNDAVSTKGRVPVIADFMASRWAFEALAVHQYKNNDYEFMIYDFEAIESRSAYVKSYLIPELQSRIEKSRSLLKSINPEEKSKGAEEFAIIAHEAGKLAQENIANPVPVGFDPLKEDAGPVFNRLYGFFEQVSDYYTEVQNKASDKKELALNYMETMVEGSNLNDLMNKHHNEGLMDLVKNLKAKNRIEEFERKLIQQIDPIYKQPENIRGSMDYSAHFLAPTKHLFGQYIDTFWFNLTVIWFMTILLYFTLYFEALKVLIDRIGQLGGRIKGKQQI
jgi:ABC transport system ATP-binding/permease protein